MAGVMDLGRLGRYEADFSTPALFKRCVNCPPEPPPCPLCPSGQICSTIIEGCDKCATYMCTNPDGSSPSDSEKSSPAGPIAGGVIGGIVVICILTFFFWRFCIKKRRQQYDDQIWQETETEKREDDLHSQRGGASRNSVRSIASTVITRASNVIQIAYIPGVTNRSVESTPDLIPPVPPIPAMSTFGSAAVTPNQQQDEHFFMPCDLRNSTYSDYTVDRTSYARTSMTPSVNRGSVPSTAYRGSAIVNAVPAQTAIRGKANPVAVKVTGKNSPPSNSRTGTPSNAALERAKQGTISTNTTSLIVARLGVPKTVTVTKSNPQLHTTAAAQRSHSPARSGVSPIDSEKSHSVSTGIDHEVSGASSRHDGHGSMFDEASSSDEDSPADRSLMGHEKLPRFSRLGAKDGREPSSLPDLRLTPSPRQPSSSPDDRARKQKHKRSGSLNQIIEEATRRASKEPRHGGLGSVGNILENYDREVRASKEPEGPFSDANAARAP